MIKWPICGPKLSLCLTVTAVWGIIQFLIMGVLFFTQSGPLIEEVELHYNETDNYKFADDLRDAYVQRAYNCWIAAFLYVGVLVLAGSQFMSNQKRMTGLNNSMPATTPFTGVGSDENGFDQHHGRPFNGE